MKDQEYLLQAALTALLVILVKDGTSYSEEELREIYTYPEQVLMATVKAYKERVMEGSTVQDFSEKIKVAAFQALTERGETGIGYVSSSNTVKA